MNTVVHQNETDYGNTIRLALEAALEPGEILSEYTLGKFSASFMTTSEYWIGLTNRRFIMISPRKKTIVIAFDLAYIQTMIYTPPAAGKKVGLSIILDAAEGKPGGEIFIRAYGSWDAYCWRMAEQFAQLRNSGDIQKDENPTGVLRQVTALCQLRINDTARKFLTSYVETSWLISQQQSVKDQLTQLSGMRMAMQIAAGMFGIVILFLLWLSIRGSARIGFGMIFSCIAVFDLLRGRPAARGTALFFAGGTALANILFALKFSYFDVVMWSAFALAMGLVLIGIPSRKRLALGIVVFIVGVIGTYASVGILARLSPKTFYALTPKTTEDYYEVFDTTQRWPARDDGIYASGLKDGEYFIRLKEPGRIYIVFPPITFYPYQHTVDVRIPEAKTGVNYGGYGLVCNYQEKPKQYYAAMFDPVENAYAVYQYWNDQTTSLSRSSWVETKAFKGPALTNRVGLTCENNAITVIINGQDQTPIQAPDMEKLGPGKSGFIVMTWEETSTPPEGFEVRFDNATFRPSKK